MKRKKSFLLLLLICVVCVFTAFFVVGCDNDESENTSTEQSSSDGTTSSTKVNSEAQAISIAKDSKKVRDKIAAAFESYRISWGSSSASEVSFGGSWTVKLTGSILGYLDKYQSNLTSKKFNATVLISSTGEITSINSYWVS